jgi:hypothetical protein
MGSTAIIGVRAIRIPAAGRRGCRRVVRALFTAPARVCRQVTGRGYNRLAI